MKPVGCILDAIGNTSLVQLRKVVPAGAARVFAKLEWENPTGSMKDRMALSMISRAEQDGRLKPGDTIVEYTGGSTGMSLALVCSVKGYNLKIVTSDAFSRDKLSQMRAFGSEHPSQTPRWIRSEREGLSSILPTQVPLIPGALDYPHCTETAGSPARCHRFGTHSVRRASEGFVRTV